jgi:hypothetical protein
VVSLATPNRLFAQTSADPGPFQLKLSGYENLVGGSAAVESSESDIELAVSTSDEGRNRVRRSGRPAKGCRGFVVLLDVTKELLERSVLEVKLPRVMTAALNFRKPHFDLVELTRIGKLVMEPTAGWC